MVDRARGAHAPPFRAPALAPGASATGHRQGERGASRATADPHAEASRPSLVTARRSRVLPASHLAFDPDGRRVQPRYVRVQVHGKTVHRRALLAEMDAGLVIAKRDSGPLAHQPVDGIFSGAFASCVAVILRSPDAIGLAHTSCYGGSLDAFIQACRETFKQHTSGERMHLGYSPRGFTDDLASRGGSVEELYDEYAGHFTGTHRLQLGLKETRWHSEAERHERLMRGVRFDHARWMARLVRRFGAKSKELPHGAVLVPRARNQPLDVFRAEPAGEPWPKPACGEPALRRSTGPDVKSGGQKRTRGPELPLNDHTTRSRAQDRHAWACDPPGTGPGRPAQTHGAPVSVFAGTTRVSSRALMADMGEGLVAAARQGFQDLYSDGFASCTGVVLASDTLIGLAHVAAVGEELRGAVEALHAEFGELVRAWEGWGHAPVRLILGYSPQALRDQLEAEAAALGLDDFLRSNECFVPNGYASLVGADAHLQAQAKRETPPREPTEAQRIDRAITSFLDSKQRELTRLGGSRPLELPHAALLVRPDGTIETFTQAPRHERL